MSELLSLFGNGTAIPVSSSVTSPIAFPSEDVSVRPGTYLGFTVAELRELGCYAASTGHEIVSYQNRLLAIARLQRTAIQEQFDGDRAEPESRLLLLDAERTALLSWLGPQVEHTAAAGLELELAKHDSVISGLILEAKSDRQVVELEKTRRLTILQNEVEVENLNGRVKRAELLLHVAQQDQAANQQELNRQAIRIEGQSHDRQQQLKELRIRIQDLDAAGITRHVAAFLIWGSSAALLGAGIAVAQLLQRALASNEAKKDDDSLLLSWLHNVKSPADLLILFAWFFGLIMGAVAIVGAFTWLMRHLLGRYDPSWRVKQSSQPSEESDSWSEWLKMFSVTNRIASKGITDQSLRQIIGLLPVIVAAAAIAFLFVAFGERSAGSLSLITAQLGPAFVMLSIVAGMLFLTNVLSAVHTKRSVSRLSVALFSVISLLPPLSLAIAGSGLGQGGSLPITALAIAMTVAASGLAFGLIYRGMFIKEDFLDREIERNEATIVSLRIAPTIARILPYVGVPAAQIPAVEQPRRNMAWAFGHLRLWLPTPRATRGEQENIDAAKLDSSAQEAALAGKQLQDFNSARVERERVRTALAQLKDLDHFTKEIHREISSLRSKWRRELYSLSVEEERAMLELQGAFDVAIATLEETPIARPPLSANPVSIGGSPSVN